MHTYHTKVLFMKVFIKYHMKVIKCTKVINTYVSYEDII